MADEKAKAAAVESKPEIYRFLVAWRFQPAGMRRIIPAGYWETDNRVLANKVSKAKGVRALTEEEAAVEKARLRHVDRPKANMVPRPKKKKPPPPPPAAKTTKPADSGEEDLFGSDEEDEASKVTVDDLKGMASEELAAVIEAHGAEAPRRANHAVLLEIARGLVSGELVKKEDPPDDEEPVKVDEATESAAASTPAAE